MITVFEFNALRPGPVILFLGAIHGNERCGATAIEKLVGELQSGTLPLLKGSVLCVPVANPRAFKKNVRYVEENLNRVFRPTRSPKTYEAKLANVLCTLVDRVDVLLDIHSISAKGDLFLYLDYPTAANKRFARGIGSKTAIVGWPELYDRLGKKVQSYSTTTYAAERGKETLLIECGQHASSSAARVAYAAIINTLRHYGLLAGRGRANSIAYIAVDTVFFRKSARERFVKEWRHLDKVTKGQSIFFDEKGRPIKASHDGYIIMPHKNAAVGEDWLYLGNEK
jgi:predicted deacylase